MQRSSSDVRIAVSTTSETGTSRTVWFGSAVVSETTHDGEQFNVTYDFGRAGFDTPQQAEAFAYARVAERKRQDVGMLTRGQFQAMSHARQAGHQRTPGMSSQQAAARAAVFPDHEAAPRPGHDATCALETRAGLATVPARRWHITLPGSISPRLLAHAH